MGVNIRTDTYLKKKIIIKTEHPTGEDHFTFGRHFSTTLFYNTFVHHFWMSLLDVTYERHIC